MLGMVLLASGLMGCKGAAPADVATSPVPVLVTADDDKLKTTLQLHVLPDLSTLEADKLRQGALLKQLHFQDRDGEAALLLSRDEGVVKGMDGEDDSEQVTLRATLYRRVDVGALFEATWQREQTTECQGSDLDAGYFLDQVQVTDLNRDGQAEITLASHGFCGGGVDPQQLKIELLQGAQHYAIDGESLVEIYGDAPFGGERSDSDDLAEASAAFRAHLDQVWERIKRMPKSD